MMIVIRCDILPRGLDLGLEDYDDHVSHDDHDDHDQVRHIASEGLDLGLPLRGQTALALAISLGKVMQNTLVLQKNYPNSENKLKVTLAQNSDPPTDGGEVLTY